MRRTRLNPRSKKRTAENIERARLMEEKFGPREEWCCKLRNDALAIGVLGPCFGPVNGHEILKRSRGGSILDMQNVVLLCNGHNESVESHPTESARMGLAQHSWEKR